MRSRRPLSGFDKLEVDTENPSDAGCILHALNEIFVCRFAALSYDQKCVGPRESDDVVNSEFICCHPH